LSDAEAEARSVREAAEEMATGIEHAAHERRERIDKETAGVEARLHRMLTGLRELTAHAEDLLRRRAEASGRESLVEALGAEARHQGTRSETSPLHDSRAGEG
jgi:hypothetical protein